MSQIRGTAGYNLGHQNPFSGPARADATDDPSPLDAIREQTSKIEDWLDSASDPIKPYDLDCLFSSTLSRLGRHTRQGADLFWVVLATYQPLDDS